MGWEGRGGEPTSAPLERSGASGTARHSLRAAAASIPARGAPSPHKRDRDLGDAGGARVFGVPLSPPRARGVGVEAGRDVALTAVKLERERGGGDG